MVDVQLVDIAVDKEFSMRRLGKMLRKAGKVGLYLRRKNIGWKILIYEMIVWKSWLQRWGRKIRAQEWLVENEAEEFGRYKETHIKEREDQDSEVLHNSWGGVGWGKSFKRNGIYRSRNKWRPLYVSTVKATVCVYWRTTGDLQENHFSEVLSIKAE